MKFEDSSAAVVVNSANGIYVAQTFVKLYFEELQAAIAKGQIALTNEDIHILLEGPDNEEYVQTWADELFPITLTRESDGKRFVFDQIGDGDVWEISEEEYNQIEWEEI